MSTKDKILKAALKLFNQGGYGATNLLEIAKSLEMSRGNITYHFKDKEIILNALSDRLWDQLKLESKSTQLPSFENLHHDAQMYYKMQRTYAFIFQDIQVLKHPLIATKMKEMCNQTIKDVEVAIAFSIQVGNMRKEAYPGMYKNLALTSWMLMFYWQYQQNVRGERGNEDGEKVIWSLLLPHLTDKGLQAFKRFFGEEYVKTLGVPFNQNIDSYLTF